MRCFGVVACLLAFSGMVALAPTSAVAGARSVNAVPQVEPPQKVPPLARALVFDRSHQPTPQPVALKVEDMSVLVEVAARQPCPDKAILMEPQDSPPAPAEQGCTVATLVVHAPGHSVFRQAIASLIMGDEGGMVSTLRLSLYHLDRSGGPLQIVVSGYTMGAHCCTVAAIVGLDGAGQWAVTHLPEQDGDAPPTVVDINHDGGRQFVLKDQRFNYVFASYVWSVLPIVVYDYAHAQLRTVTTQPDYASFLLAYFRQGFPAFKAPPPPDRKGVNAFLAAYVANSANLGRFRAGWTYMLHWYDRSADDDQTWCALDPSVQDGGVSSCPTAYVRKTAYPQKLALFLLQTGYITHAQCVAVGYDPEKIQIGQDAIRAANTAHWRAAHPGPAHTVAP
ncbi:MAG: thylakoid lumen protein [Acetobacter sp.]